MVALIKKELSAYFASPIGYIFSAIFILVTGYTFYTYVIVQAAADIVPIISMIYSISMILVPLLTMRLISEEKKQKTDQALVTAPMTITEIVLGKFLGAFILYALCASIVFLYSTVIAVYALPVWGITMGGYIGVLCLGAMLIAIGLFVSALTENQFIAAVVSYGGILMLVLLDSSMSGSTDPFMSSVYNYFSISLHFASFTDGLFSPFDVVYYLSFAFLFIFLTIRMIDKKRWS